MYISVRYQGRIRIYPPPPNSLFNITLNHMCDWSRVTVCTVPTSQCVYDWSRVTVCMVPTSQCVYDWSRVTVCTVPTSQCVYDWSRVTVCIVC